MAKRIVEPRDKHLGIRMSESELEALRAQAREDGYDDVATWVRDTLRLVLRHPITIDDRLSFLSPLEIVHIKKAATIARKPLTLWIRTTLAWWAQEPNAPCYPSYEPNDNLENL